MVKMLIKLDDVKIERIGKYDKDKMWDVIDDIFEEHFCSKEILSDGSRMYYGSEQRPTKHFADIVLCYQFLRDQEWFASSVKTWILYDDDGETDFIKRMLKLNPYFAKAYNQ